MTRSGLGLPVFPCLESKAPACPGGFKSAQEGAEGIRALWRRYPGPLIGVPTGPPSGFDVLDVDKAGGGEWYAANKHRLPQPAFTAPGAAGCTYSFMLIRASSAAPARSRPASMCGPLAAMSFGGPRPRARVPGLSAGGRAHGSLNGIPGVIRVVLEARDGERNRALFWAACRHAEMARDGLISTAFAVELLVEAGMRRGLTRIETLATVRSAFGGRARRG